MAPKALPPTALALYQLLEAEAVGGATLA